MTVVGIKPVPSLGLRCWLTYAFMVDRSWAKVACFLDVSSGGNAYNMAKQYAQGHDLVMSPPDLTSKYPVASLRGFVLRCLAPNAKWGDVGTAAGLKPAGAQACVEDWLKRRELSVGTYSAERALAVVPIEWDDYRDGSLFKFDDPPSPTPVAVIRRPSPPPVKPIDPATLDRLTPALKWVRDAAAAEWLKRNTVRAEALRGVADAIVAIIEDGGGSV